MKMHPRLLGPSLRGVGATLMIVALAGALGTGAWANASFLAPLRQAVAVVSQVSPAPTGSPTAVLSPSASSLPASTPTPPAYRVPRGGKLRLTISGSLSFGSRESSQTLFNGSNPFVPSPSASPSPGTGGTAVNSSQNQTIGNAGMLAHITRRTARTALDFQLPFGFSTTSKATFGAFALTYNTALYALGYGSQSLSVLGQLPSGSTIRGVSLDVPAPGGDLMFVNGPTFGAGGEIIPMEGLRYRGSHGSEIYEAAFMHASGPVTGKAEATLLGLATSRGTLTGIGEIAFESRPGGDFSPSGPSYQFRIDDGGLRNYVSATHRHYAQGYVSFGGGELNGDDFTDIAFHHSGTSSFLFDTSLDHLGTGVPGDSSDVRVTTAGYSGGYKLGTYGITLSSQKTSSTGTPSQWQGSSNAQVSAQVGKGFVLLGSILNRQVQEGGASLGQVGYNAVFQQSIRNVALSLSAASYRQTSTLAGPATGVIEGIGLARQFRKTGFGINQSFSHTYSDISNAFQRSTQLSVSRQISPVISLQATYQLQNLNDRLNPAANGKSSSFSLQINAPFSFGNGIVTGRVDPHLPATIVGRVLNDVSSNPTFAGLVSSGLNNVAVVLDDKEVQRTTLSGDFQFSFVSPGQHQIRIENSSLPRGVTVDVPVYTLIVQGGQTAQVSFFVGTFGGIQGHVYGRDDHGAIIPLANVSLRVDGGAYSTTDQTGAYGFGKLRPGKHEVTVIEGSVPAFASFDEKKLKQSVDVKNGVYTDLDFSADPLGSIEGTVYFDKDVYHDAGTSGVLNAYVVAEPGEHAAIVDADGSYVVDDLPPGDYTLSVDPETIPEGLGAGPDSIAVTLGSREHYKGAAFLVGHLHKKVVFSFSQGGAGTSGAPNLPKVRLSESRLPPKGSATITVDAPKSAESVTVSALDQVFKLAFHEASGTWVGLLQVPTNVKVGTYPVDAKVASGTQPESTTVTVDAKMPVVIMQMEPPNPVKGSYVRVRARFLVDAREGDRIQWEDGQVTTLGRPLVGRVFTFNVRVSLRPLHGLLLTRVGGLPISLM